MKSQTRRSCAIRGTRYGCYSTRAGRKARSAGRGWRASANSSIAKALDERKRSDCENGWKRRKPSAHGTPSDRRQAAHLQSRASCGGVDWRRRRAYSCSTRWRAGLRMLCPISFLTILQRHRSAWSLIWPCCAYARWREQGTRYRGEHRSKIWRRISYDRSWPDSSNPELRKARVELDRVRPSWSHSNLTFCDCSFSDRRHRALKRGRAALAPASGDPLSDRSDLSDRDRAHLRLSQKSAFDRAVMLGENLEAECSQPLNCDPTCYRAGVFSLQRSWDELVQDVVCFRVRTA